MAYIVILSRLAFAIMQTALALSVDEDRKGKTMSRPATLGGLLLEILATYAKICMGFFQVAAIVILTLQVSQRYSESIEQISYWLYFGVTVWNICIILAVFIYAFVLLHCLNSTSEGESCYDISSTGIKLNAACFCLLSILLVIVMFPLFSELMKVQRGRMELTKGVKMLFTVFIVFTFCYVTRTIYDLCVDPNLNFPNIFSGVVLPILWDFVPILLMFTYHYNNMKSQKSKGVLSANLDRRSKTSTVDGSSSLVDRSALISTHNSDNALPRVISHSESSSEIGEKYLDREAKSSLVREAEALMLAQRKVQNASEVVTEHRQTTFQLGGHED